MPQTAALLNEFGIVATGLDAGGTPARKALNPPLAERHPPHGRMPVSTSLPARVFENASAASRFMCQWSMVKDSFP